MKTILRMICVMLLMTGSSFGKNDVRFCGFGETPESKDALRIDLDGHRLMGSDAASHLDIVKSTFAVGFFGSIPLSLPRRPLSSIDIPAKWQLADYQFATAVLSSTDPDWLLIYGSPIDARSKVNSSSTVLYSQSSGVIAMRITWFPEGKKTIEELYSCGKQHLSVSSFSIR